MSELVVGSIAGLAANSYVVGIASGSTLDLANAKAGSLPDTALSAVPGLALLKTVSFSAVSSVVEDDIFSADYDDYIITGSGTGSANDYTLIQWRAGGVTNSTASSYYTQLQENASASNVTTSTGNRLFRWQTNQQNFWANVYQPFLAVRTGIWTSDRRDTVVGSYSSYHTQAVSYDGFILTPNTGTITGTISIFGVKK